VHDIDVHIIHHKEPQWLLDRCIASMDGQPVNIHIVKGINEWPPFKGRALGFSKGSAKYVSYVDPDDVVLPGCFEKLLQYVGADLVWGNEGVVIEDGGETVHTNKSPHHAFLLKRGLDLDYSGSFRDVVNNHTLSRAHLDETVYIWNYYLGTLCKRRGAK